jgi:hypothetical protein
MSAPASPEVEHLLATAHSELAGLQATARTLSRHGLAATELPNNDTLIGLAILADHGRAQVEAGLLDHWALLQHKGLVHGDLNAHSTPRLRLLLLVAPATTGLSDLRARLANDVARPAPPALFRCAPLVPDLIWGQRVRLDYQLDSADYLLIEPGHIFRRQPVLIHTGGGAAHGSVELPGDNGPVVFTLLGNDGELYRHTTTLKLRDAYLPHPSTA